ncbi:hypothetical protein [Halorubrum sp. GN11GM_10-3_MGM]|uniref:hypothetical protein n=1 Tax=Halorubrum sp. GN11GM_10-3_MGM TaxID=2518111 RepID=UPI0010F8F4FD|nr:hypothetical protein [Halorubrum sp. GN11GM_10-3_MGM]TKX70955.1 hypothetical protein EXE40_08645 [Halorubrum sp. GN11GM_10-3_MGM]
MAGAKGVKIADLEVPESLRPGDRATARIDATNTSNFIGPWDPDKCNDGNVGLLVEGVLVGPNGEEFVGDTVCAEQHDIVTSYEVTSDVPFEAPETEGTHRYEAYVRTAETGEESSRVSESIDVFRDEDDAPEEPPDDDNNTDNPFNLPDPSGSPPGLPARANLVLLAVAGLGSAYMLGQLFDIQIGGGA